VWTNTKLEFNGTRQAPTASVGNLVEGDECKITVKGKEMYDGTFTARATAVSNSNYVLPENTTCEFVIWSDSVKVAHEAMGDLIDLIPDSVKDTVEEAVTTAIEDAVSELSSAVTNALEEAVNDLWSRFMSRFGNVFG